MFTPVFAHPGNTASDGCHYCRTNCDKWGVAWNERHCHNKKSSTTYENSLISKSENDNGTNWILGTVVIGIAMYLICKNKK